jgi:hypothetical protein
MSSHYTFARLVEALHSRKPHGNMRPCHDTGITRRRGLAALLLLAAPTMMLAGAPADLAGDWQGKLAVDAKNALTVRFTFSKATNGAYTAVLNSPDNAAVKDTAVSGVTWDGTNLKFAVPSLSGSYVGKLSGGKIAGQWTQPGGALPLELAPWQKVVLSADVVKPYIGSWSSTLKIGGNSQNMVFTFKQAAAGGLEGTFSMPDQGMNVPISDITVENGELSMKVAQARMEYRGRINGNTIAGKFKAPSPLIPVDGIAMDLKRGEYKPAPVPLKISAESFAALKGSWQGTVTITNPQNAQKINLPVVLRFESNAKGEYFGYLDSPTQNAKGIVVSEATLAGGKFTARVPTVQSEYTGTLAGKQITGEWTQGGQRLPLVLTQTP